MVKWTAHAKAQVRSIHDYIAQDSTLYAKRVSMEFVQATLKLNELPRLGRKMPEINQDNYRELGLYSYRILYEIKDDGLIMVLAVIHKRRHLGSHDMADNFHA